MIPDKIYMPNELLSEEWGRHIEGEDTCYLRADAIRKEMERLKNEIVSKGLENPSDIEAVAEAMYKAEVLEEVVSILDTLEEKSEKPTNPVDLEKEIKKYLQEVYDRDTTVSDVARHFYELGRNAK